MRFLNKKFVHLRCVNRNWYGLTTWRCGAAAGLLHLASFRTTRSHSSHSARSHCRSDLASFHWAQSHCRSDIAFSSRLDLGISQGPILYPCRAQSRRLVLPISSSSSKWHSISSSLVASNQPPMVSSHQFYHVLSKLLVFDP